MQSFAKNAALPCTKVAPIAANKFPWMHNSAKNAEKSCKTCSFAWKVFLAPIRIYLLFNKTSPDFSETFYFFIAKFTAFRLAVYLCKTAYIKPNACTRTVSDKVRFESPVLNAGRSKAWYYYFCRISIWIFIIKLYTFFDIFWFLALFQHLVFYNNKKILWGKLWLKHRRQPPTPTTRLSSNICRRCFRPRLSSYPFCP